MESECNSANKRSYDISKSKRTRKPLSLTSNGTLSERKISSIVFDKPEEDESDRRSLKQLISEEENRKRSNDGDGINDSNRRSSLEEHFTEEETQLQVVRRSQNEEGRKVKGMVGRYVKVLSHLIKVKRGQQPRIISRKKPLPHLPV